MAYIATLKKNNTVIYPQTKSTAVYEDDGVTPLENTVVKKSTAAADANKMIKADGTKALVEASNIDFTTFDTGWQKITLASAMSEADSITGGLWYRNVKGTVTIYGHVKKGSGNLDPQELLATLPDAAMPYISSSYPTESTPLIVSVSGGGIARIAIQNADNKLIYGTSTTSPWVFLSISYKGKVS